MNTPRLRFKEYNCSDYPEWKEVPFCIAFSFIGNNTLSRSELSLDVKTSVRNIHYGDILIKYGSIVHSSFDAIPYIIKIDDKTTKEKLLKTGDVIFADTAEDNTVGKACEIVLDAVFDKIVAGLHTIAVRPNDSFAIGYLGYFFNSALFHNQLLPLIQGIKVSSISKSALFNETKVYYPSLPEQQKIADFLSSYDEKISIQRERVEALERRKKGLLQKVFSQEIRFKDEDGRMYGKWDSKTIGDVTVPTAGATPSTKNGSYWIGGDIPWMSSGEVHNGQIYKTEKFITAKGYSNSSTKLLPPNTVVVALAGQGKTRGAVAITRIKLCTNQSLAGLVLKEGSNVISDYLYQYLKNQYSELRKVSSGEGGRGGLNLNIISEFPIMLPSLKEQRKISDFFTVIDDQLNIEKERLATMETIKKGLLQGLFC